MFRTTADASRSDLWFAGEDASALRAPLPPQPVRALNDRIDAFWADTDLRRSGAFDLDLPALPMRPTVRVPLNGRVELANRVLSDLIWNDGLMANAPVPGRWDRPADFDEVIDNLVVSYHDYPYSNIDQIEARDCA